MKVPYTVQQYSPDAVTVCIDAFIPFHLKGILDLRAYIGKGTPLIPSSPFQPELMKLAELGFDYIDIGTNCEWIAAEIPAGKVQHHAVYSHAGDQICSIKYKVEKLTEKKR